jgi:hypothetical protein
MSGQIDRETVLYAFATEPTHDRATLERYLKQYPDLSEELVDLSAELRLNETLEKSPADVLPDTGAQAAWEEFISCRPTNAAGAKIIDLFAQYRGPAFAALAQSLNVPRSILTALRDGLVMPSSIPTGFIRRFSEATTISIDTVRSSLSQQSHVPVGLAFKSDAKPTHQGQTTFRELVLRTTMTDEQRSLLLHECDKDEHP